MDENPICFKTSLFCWLYIHFMETGNEDFKWVSVASNMMAGC